MTDESSPQGSEEERLASNRRLLERIEKAKAWDREDELRWRDATPEERAAEVSSLLETAAMIERSSGVPYIPEKRKFPRLDQLRDRHSS